LTLILRFDSDIDQRELWIRQTTHSQRQASSQRF